MAPELFYHNRKMCHRMQMSLRKDINDGSEGLFTDTKE